MVYYYYYGYGRRREPSIFDGFTLSPLPYPVLLLLIVVFIFIGLKSIFSLEEAFMGAEFQINWPLLIVPLLLIFAVKWLSSNGYDGRKWGYYGAPTPNPNPNPWGCYCSAYPATCMCYRPVYVPR